MNPVQNRGRVIKSNTIMNIKINENNKHRIEDKKRPRSISYGMKLRLVKKSDAEMLFLWRNDSLTRTQSLNTGKVNWSDHTAWLKRAMADKSRRLFVAEEDGEAVGTGRVDRVKYYGKEVFELSWTVSPEHRGKGIGTKMVVAMVGVPWIEDKMLLARIKFGNLASEKIALKAGFKKVAEKENLSYWAIVKGR